MKVLVLGQLLLRSAERDVALTSPSQRAVLALLAARLDQVVSLDELARAVWADAPPRTADRTLHAYVSRLRRLLPDGALLSAAGGYRLSLAPGEVDLHEFARAVEEAREVRELDPRRAAQKLGDGLALWRGDPLCDVADRELVADVVAWAEELRRTAEDDLLALELVDERAVDRLARLERAVAQEPLRETRWALLLRALHGAGRTADALAAYQRARRTLVDELGVEPGPVLRAAHDLVLASESGAGTTGERPRQVSVPAPLTALIGRDADLDAVLLRLRSSRLVTLLGPGGAGKTRLATEVAHRCAPAYELVHFVDLTRQGAGADVLAAVVAELGVREEPGRPLVATLQRHVQNRTVLLVLDNCEHLAASAATAVKALLTAGPGIAALATSREPLGLVGESRWYLTPLAVPDGDGVEAVAGSPAAGLLRARARDVTPEFEVEAGNAAAVAAVCRSLDGLPLALELAASRLDQESVHDLADRLRHAPLALTSADPTAPRRHVDLVALVAWSTEALDPEAARVLQHVSVLRGSFGAPAAAAVTGRDAADVVPLLTELARRSLLEPTGAHRYRILEPVRAAIVATASESLLDESRSRLLEWVAELVTASAPGTSGRLEMLDGEQAHLQAALEHALEDEAHAALGVRAAVASLDFWLSRGPRRTGMLMLRRLVAHAAALPVEQRTRPLLLGTVLGCLSGADGVADLVEDCSALAGDASLPRAHARVARGWFAVARGADDEAAGALAADLDEQDLPGDVRLWRDSARWWLCALTDDAAGYRALADDLLRRLTAMGDPHLIGAYTRGLADAHVVDGELTSAARLARQAARAAAEARCRSCAAHAEYTLVLAGAGSRTRLAQAAEAFHDLDELPGLLAVLDAAVPGLLQEDPERAAEVARAADALRASSGLDLATLAQRRARVQAEAALTRTLGAGWRTPPSLAADPTREEAVALLRR